MAKVTLRVPEALHAEGAALAASLGIPLNALLAVALREYLDRRPKAETPGPQVPAPVTPSGPQVPTLTRQQRRQLERQTRKAAQAAPARTPPSA